MQISPSNQRDYVSLYKLNCSTIFANGFRDMVRVDRRPIVCLATSLLHCQHTCFPKLHTYEFLSCKVSLTRLGSREGRLKIAQCFCGFLQCSCRVYAEDERPPRQGLGRRISQGLVEYSYCIHICLQEQRAMIFEIYV
jgi:hypothetical protein